MSDSVTIKDIAKHAKVSVMTVSRYYNSPEKLSEKTRKKIENAISKLNYQPNEIARSLISKKTNTIGVIVPDIRNPFFNNIFHEIENYVKDYHYNLLLCNTQEDPEQEKKYVQVLLSRHVDGIIIAPVSKESVLTLVDKKVNFVLIDRKFDGVETDFIGCDHYQGMYDAVNHLIGLSHKKIGIIKGGDHLYPYYERHRGYKDALSNANIKHNQGLVKTIEILDNDSAYNSAIQLITQEKPTAIVACNNTIGLNLLKAISELKMSIPQNISVIIFDYTSLYSFIKPQITHVAQSIEFIGTNAAMRLVHRIKNPALQYEQFILKPKLEIGESCIKI